MKREILMLTAFYSSIFASNISENLTYKEDTQETAPNIGHFILSTGAHTSHPNYKEIVPVICFGYQSKIMNNPIFQSVMIEWTWTAPFAKNLLEKENIENISSTKIMGVQYFGMSDTVRYFVSTGTHYNTTEITLPLKEEEEEESKRSQAVFVNTHFGVSLAAGVETGLSSGLITIFRIGYDHPLIPLLSNNDLTPKGNFLLTFGIGF